MSIDQSHVGLPQFRHVHVHLVSINIYGYNRYRFQLPRNAQLNLPIGRHVSIRATVGTRQAMRSYTPISDPDVRGYFELLVKTYPNGTVSKYLAELNIGDFVDFKGPKGSFEYEPHVYHHLGMIAGGTGITPIYQIIKHSLSQPKDKTKLSLIYANVNEEDILLHAELESLAKEHSERFKISYTLDNPPSNWKQGKGFVTSDMIKQHLPSPSKGIRVLVCGPPPMVASMQSHCNALGYDESMFYRF